jgi:glucan biosynthesis protein C
VVYADFFLLSGAGSWYSLQFRSNRRYLVERGKRILLPLYTVGLFLLLPVQAYFEIFSNEGYRGTLWAMFPGYFSDLKHFSFVTPAHLVHVPFSGHLWFLQFLFLVSLAALPLIRYLQSEQGASVIDRLARWSSRKGGIFIFLIPVIIIRIGLRSIIGGEHTWADFFEFMAFFISGSILAATPRFTESLKKNGRLCLTLGILCFIGEIYFILVLGYKYPQGERFSLMFVLFETMMSVGRFSWIVCVLSLGTKYLNFNNKILSYGNEAVLPFYIFHQTIILCVGWFVIPLTMGIMIKYIIIVTVSLVLIMMLYEGIVRHLNAMRFFFGMRPKKNTA